MTTVTFLGTATSVGVPVIGCSCPVCTSTDPRNTRTRSSLHVQSEDRSILIDTGPDLREQALREKLTEVHDVLYTHCHIDHVAGFDELRAFGWHLETPLPIYAGQETIAALQRMYPYAFAKDTPRNYIRVEPRLISGSFSLDPVKITPLPVEHGSAETFGFHFDFPSGKSMAYISDLKRIPSTTRALMDGLDVLALDSLRFKDHPNHMTLDEALATIAEIQPAQGYLTHITHDLEHAEISANLPANVQLAYDGLKIRF